MGWSGVGAVTILVTKRLFWTCGEEGYLRKLLILKFPGWDSNPRGPKAPRISLGLCELHRVAGKVVYRESFGPGDYALLSSHAPGPLAVSFDLRPGLLVPTNGLEPAGTVGSLHLEFRTHFTPFALP